MSKINKISLSSKVKQNLRESTLWVTGAIGLILFLALSTYDIDDPGVSYVGNESQVQNAIGKFGALLADFLFNLFGASSYLLVIIVLYFGWSIYRESNYPENPNRGDLFMRTSGFILLLITSCALSTLHFSGEFYRETAGGILGQVIGNYLESSMKLLGATTLLFFVWLASISLFLNVSWIKIIDEIGKYSLVFWEFCLSKIDEIKDKFEEKRKKANSKKSTS